MRHVIGVLGLVAVTLAAAPAVADERAEWGVAMAVGAESGSAALLMRNDRGYQLVVVDAAAAVHGVRGAMTVTDIRPGDHVDYSVSTWAGMDIADVLVVSPRRHADARF